MVKANAKTVAYLDDIRELKRHEYIQFMQDKNEGNPDAEVPNEHDLKEREQLNNALKEGLTVYEKEMITGGYRNYENIVERVKAVVERNDVKVNISEDGYSNDRSVEIKH